jgi:hypothetical protein
MKASNINLIVSRLFDEIEKLIPVYMENPVDNSIANGNCAVCIIDEAGDIYGKMYGTYRPRQRQSYKVAWTKASQVWLTGYKMRRWFLTALLMKTLMVLRRPI